MKIVFVTGAGISVESNVPTYRCENGLWKTHSHLSTKEALETNRSELNEFMSNVFDTINAAEPNAAHKLIADLEKDHEVTVLTQNIDVLHEKAGSTKVVHLHGKAEWTQDDVGLRPDVVLFGEEVKNLYSSLEEIYDCDLLVYVGTSGAVHPVSSFIKMANHKRWKCKTVEINPNETEISYLFEKHIRESASTGISKLKDVV